MKQTNFLILALSVFSINVLYSPCAKAESNRDRTWAYDILSEFGLKIQSEFEAAIAFIEKDLDGGHSNINGFGTAGGDSMGGGNLS